jgi:acetyl-CoA decarbonylase/synthase complex subunit beta
MEYPHTSCGCFEAIDFLIPETGVGHGIIDRNHDGVALNGLPFSAMANQTGGGKQMPGFNGISIQYIISPKFQQYDAINAGLKSGIELVVWMGKTVKDRVYDLLPEDIRDKIATEEEVPDLNDLPAWLEKVQHPVIETEEYKAAVRGMEEEEEEWEEEGAMVPMGMGTVGMTIPGVGGAGGFKVILKNCKIHAESIIIKKIEPKRKKK